MGFLQHGSIMVEPIYHEMAELFSIEESEIRAHAIALRSYFPI